MVEGDHRKPVKYRGFADDQGRPWRFAAQPSIAALPAPIETFVLSMRPQGL